MSGLHGVAFTDVSALAGLSLAAEGHGWPLCSLLCPERGRMLLLPAVRRRKPAVACPVRFEKEAASESKRSKASVAATTVAESAVAAAVTVKLLASRRQSLDEGRRPFGWGDDGAASRRVGQLKAVMRKVSGGRQAGQPSASVTGSEKYKQKRVASNDNSTTTFPVTSESVNGGEAGETSCSEDKRPTTVNNKLRSSLPRAVKQAWTASIKQRPHKVLIRSESAGGLRAANAGGREPPSKAGGRNPPTQAGGREPPTKAGVREPPTKAGVREPPSKAGGRQTPTKAPMVTSYQAPAVSLHSEPVKKCGSVSSIDSGIVSPSTEPGSLTNLSAEGFFL